jgi:hypothetical protein
MKISCCCLQWRCSAAGQGTETAPDEAKTRKPQRPGHDRQSLAKTSGRRRVVCNPAEQKR